MPDERASVVTAGEFTEIEVEYMLGLQWSSELTLGDVTTFLAFLVASVSVYFLAKQLKANVKQAEASVDQAKASVDQAKASVKQAEASVQQAREAAAVQRGRFLLDVVNRYFDDPGMRRLYQKLDKGEFRFNLVDYVGSDDAEAVSRMLYTFDTMAHLVNLGVLSLEDVAIMGFRITRTLKDPEILEVLAWMDAGGGSQGRGRGAHSHQPARMLADQLAELRLEDRAERGERLG